MKLTAGFDFANDLRETFERADPGNAKGHWWVDCLFALSGSACTKAAHRMLMTLPPGFNFTNVLPATIEREDHKIAKCHWWLNCLFALLGSSLIKAAHKLIPGGCLRWSTYFWCSKRNKNLLQRHLESDTTLFRLYCLEIGDLLPDIFSSHSASSGICICIQIHIVAWIQVKF
jgi:hypothetical protein